MVVIHRVHESQYFSFFNFFISLSLSPLITTKTQAKQHEIQRTIKAKLPNVPPNNNNSQYV